MPSMLDMPYFRSSGTSHYEMSRCRCIRSVRPRSAADGERTQLVAVERVFVGPGNPDEKDFRIEFGETDRALIRQMKIQGTVLALPGHAMS